MTKLNLKRLLGDCNGATAIEYGLILAMIVLAMMASLSAFAGESILTWDTVAQKTHDAVQQATAS